MVSTVLSVSSLFLITYAQPFVKVGGARAPPVPVESAPQGDSPSPCEPDRRINWVI